MLTGRVMAVFRQMRTAVEFATLKQNARNSGGCQKSRVFAPPPKSPLGTSFGVVAIRNKGLKEKPVPNGLVAASDIALRDIAAMSAHKAEDQLINRVPYVVRRQGAEALAAQIEYPDDTSGRFSLPCNTGPRGSGKTVLQRQNMLQVARDFGFLAVEIEFNGIQFLDPIEGNTKFRRRVANRILCYLPKYWGLGWSACLDAIAKDFEGKDESPLDGIRQAVEELKKALNHKGPVLLAVDELLMAKGSTEDNLSSLCLTMDESLRLSADNGIFVAVSVYDFVDLGALASRNLVHQVLPPILPVLLDSAVLTRLPVWLQVFFDKKKRKELNLKLTSDMGGVPKLLAESGGHPRRLEALIKVVEQKILPDVKNNAKNKANNKRTTFEESQVLPSLLQSVSSPDRQKQCLGEMDDKLDLRVVGEQLSSFSKAYRGTGIWAWMNSLLVLLKLRPNEMDSVSLVLLKYLFVTVNMDEADAEILRNATVEHYQLVPHGTGHVGYLPLPALQQFCAEQLLESSNNKVISFLEHAKGVADANLSATRLTKTNTKEWSKYFEMGMFHALCGAVLAEERVTEGMFRRSPDNLPQTRCTEIEWAKDVKLFPSAVEKGTTLRVCDDATLRRVSQVGAFNAQKEKSFKGLAFVPTDEGNTCCDFVLVLPTVDRPGRAVFAVQCKDVAAPGEGLHPLAHFRYGRHCFEAEDVFLEKKKKNDAPKSIENEFRKKFCDIVDEDKDTRVVFVLATVNELPQVRKKSVFTGVNLPVEAKYKNTKLLEDEGSMDLQHMCGWCPTVGYGALLVQKLREVPI